MADDFQHTDQILRAAVACVSREEILLTQRASLRLRQEAGRGAITMEDFRRLVDSLRAAFPEAIMEYSEPDEAQEGWICFDLPTRQFDIMTVQVDGHLSYDIYQGSLEVVVTLDRGGQVFDYIKKKMAA